MGLEALLTTQIIGLQPLLDAKLGGSTGSTDNRVLRSDGTGGVTVQDSGVTIDDSGNISGLGTISSTLAGSMSSVNPQTKIVVYGGFSGYGVGFDNNGELSTVVNSSLKSTLGTQLKLSSNGEVQFNSATNLSGSYDTKLLRNATGPSAEIRAAGGLLVKNAAGSADAALACGAITASGTILPEANETRSVGSSSVRYLQGHFRQLVLTSTSANPQVQLGASGEGYIERSSSAVQIGYGFSSNFAVAATFVSCSQPFGTRAYTFATLPSAATHAGRLAQITDSSVTTNGTIAAGGGSDRALVFSNGTDWIVAVA